ncbi:hypothetical protein ACFVH6_25970 [Spirillospora sp. NPDC127200]
MRAITIPGFGGADVLRLRAETLPLERAAEAHRRAETGATTGGLVLAVAP